MDEKEVMLNYILFQVRAFMSKNINIANSKIITCLRYILENLKATDKLELIELVGYLSHKEMQKIKKWND